MLQLLNPVWDGGGLDWTELFASAITQRVIPRAQPGFIILQIILPRPYVIDSTGETDTDSIAICKLN